MANKKFSEFTTKTDPANVDFVVGYDGSTNVKIAPSNLSSGGATSLNGLSDVTITGSGSTISSYFVNIPSGLSGTPSDNLLIQGGGNLTTGSGNTILGDADTGSRITTSAQNVIIGSRAAGNSSAATFQNNIVIGYNAKYSGTGHNAVIIGDHAGLDAGSQTKATIIGDSAGQVGGNETVLIGREAGAYGSSAQTGAVAVGAGQCGRSNTATYTVNVGYAAGYSNTSGLYNTNLGYKAGYQNTTNANRTYMGYEAGNYNSGANNTGIGYRACNGYYSFGTGQGTGADNTGIGYEAMSSLNGASAIKNTAVGVQSLGGVLTAGNNTALGYRSGFNVTSGSDNTIIGYQSMDANTDGSDNVAIGASALGAETSGDQNTAIGFEALVAQDQQGIAINTAVGYRADDGNLTGYHRVCIGGQAGNSSATGNNVICIGYNSNEGSSSASNVVTLGNSSIATLRCQVTSITALSDERDKTSIEDLPYGLDFVNSLQPKKFVWDNREESDKYGNKSFSSRKGAKDIGFIAQELQSVDDDFLNLVYDANPEKLEATYGRLVPVLVKAIQDLSAKVTALENA